VTTAIDAGRVNDELRGISRETPHRRVRHRVEEPAHGARQRLDDLCLFSPPCVEVEA
jgi:hypothetical protein